MFKKILVPLDRSHVAEKALALAAVLAQQNEGQLTLFHVPIHHEVVPPVPIEYSATTAGYDWSWSQDLVQESNRNGERYLIDMQNRYLHPNVDVQIEIGSGDVASAIWEESVVQDSDLIAMSTHGYSGMTRWILGSVTEKVLRVASCPVLVLRDDRPIRRILVPLDGSNLAEYALEPAFELAQALGAEITLLRVDADLTQLGYRELRGLETMERGLGTAVLEGYYAQGQAYLESVARRFRNFDVPVTVMTLRGKPASEILRMSVDFDLVAMATHGRSGVEKWVYGSVTEKVLRQAERGMLIVRPPLALLKG
ncbi:MAG TPA: universal stress protein [Anaerolineae bacterium]|nr:universal stress protein [Anaerolineae bacterium]